MIRKASFSGAFYPSNKEELKEQITSFLKEANGKKRDVISCISPHAGYIYSGRCAAHTFSSIEEKETFVIIGPNHSGIGSGIAISNEIWETPLGKVEPDTEFIEELLDTLFIVDPLSHKFEHSIEVQLPFLQMTQRNFKIVPISLSSTFYDFEICEKIAKKIISVAKKLKRNFCLIASSDFTHFGPMYGFLPENPEKIDKEAIRLILNLDAKKFNEFSFDKTICGYGGITVAMIIAKEFNAKGELLEYYTSGDVTGDKSNWVGYASIIFIK